MRLFRMLAGRLLTCGCTVGVYETYAGRIESLIDAQGEACRDPAHRPGARLSSVPAGPPAANQPGTP
jgi:hypothetical protein